MAAAVLTAIVLTIFLPEDFRLARRWLMPAVAALLAGGAHRR
jgi:hypothetical protein